jgi:hypothetical protein
MADKLKVDATTRLRLQYVANVAEGIIGGKYTDDEPTKRALGALMQTFEAISNFGGGVAVDINEWLTRRHENTSMALLALLQACGVNHALACVNGEEVNALDELASGASFDYDDVYAAAHRALAPIVATQQVMPCVDALKLVREWCGDGQSHNNGINSGMVIAVYGVHVWDAAYNVVFGDA